MISPADLEAWGRDVSAEWNVYNNPVALAVTMKARISLILVSLDSAKKVPVTKSPQNRWVT